MTVFVLLTISNHTFTEWRPFIVSSSSLPWKWHCMHTTCWCKSIDFILRLLFSLHNILMQKNIFYYLNCAGQRLAEKNQSELKKNCSVQKKSCKDDRSNAAPNVVSILQKKQPKCLFSLKRHKCAKSRELIICLHVSFFIAQIPALITAIKQA